MDKDLEDSLSIISKDPLVTFEAKPIERRVIFEEAAVLT